MLAKPATLLTSSPEIYWINSEGNRVRATLNSSVVAGTDSIDILTAEFDPLLASQNSIYTCRATIQSIAFEQPQLLSSTVAANVQCKLLCVLVTSLVTIIWLFSSSTTTSNFSKCTGWTCTLLCWNFLDSEM